MNKINFFLAVLSFLTNIAIASNLQSDKFYCWSVLGSLGYDWYKSTYKGYSINSSNSQPAIDNGQTAFGRFSIAKEIFFYKNFHFGIESGVQNGNTFRLNIQENDLMSIGGILPQVTIKPELDLLATVFYFPINSLIFGVAKFGPVWRRMQINDRVTFNDLSQTGLEMQFGAGIPVSSNANLSLNYQLISNGSSNYRIDIFQGIATINNIPKQQGLLLSFAYII